MGFNYVTNIEQCAINLPQMINVGLLYYAHIPTAVIALFFGFFVLFKNKKDLSAKILFAISATFSVWVILNLIAWVSYDSRNIMFAWAPLGIFETLFFVFSLYFVYVFIDKKDISFAKKTILGILILPGILLAATKINLSGFNLLNCEAVETKYIFVYDNIVEALLSLWIIVIFVKRYLKAQREHRKEILLLAVGIILFLLSFFVASYIAYAINMYSLEVYGLFGMTIFMGFLAYLVVKFKAFSIKLMGAQVLVAALWVGIGAQFFFIQNPTNKVLNAITFCLALGFGYFLVRSVKLEVRRKDELESLSTQLAAANDKLHQLDKAKSEFISIASHQLRTPLTSIKGFTSLLLEGTYGQIPETQKTALEKVYISNERLIHLVEDLLNVSRMEAGKMEFDFQDAQVEDLAKEAVDALELSAKGKGLYLDYRPPAVPLPALKLDVNKIKEVISNMIDNAVKYTQKGGISVQIARANYWDKVQKNVVRIVVSDTGMGMDKSELDMIFNKFQRGRETSHYHTDGTGLGMYIGKKIVEAHHGRIWAESEGKGKGSKFILELPVG